jgi:transcriptional regulator with XRE-family HTH domain
VTDYGEQLTLHVAGQLQEARIAQGMSLEALAGAAGLHRTFVGLVMRGRRGMTLATAGCLARALGLSLGSLVHAAEESLSRRDA